MSKITKFCGRVGSRIRELGSPIRSRSPPTLVAPSVDFRRDMLKYQQYLMYDSLELTPAERAADELWLSHYNPLDDSYPPPSGSRIARANSCRNAREITKPSLSKSISAQWTR